MGDPSSSTFMSGGVSWTSPATEEIPLRISCLNPEDMDTATIITRKLTPIDTDAILPLNLRREAMNLEASITSWLQELRFLLLPPPAHSPEHI